MAQSKSQAGDEPAVPEKAPEGAKLKEVDALISKDLSCVIATTVYAHELPILAAAHGSDRVQVQREREVTVPGFNPAAEMERLRRKYKGKNKDPISEAYPLGLRDLIAMTGVDATGVTARTEALVKVRELPAVRREA